jgi:selenocysteine lyase/cysteine desulfurase
MKKSTGSANLHEQFPILGEGFYANHAAIAPWPAATSRAVEEFAVENSQTGPRYYAAWLKRERLLRAQLAGLLNADSADDIALVKNTSEAISFTAAGVDWRQGDNIVTPAAEFPSNALPWAALSARGVGIREVDIRQHHDPETALLNRVDARTRVLTASSVQWTDGFRLDLEKLGKGLNHPKTLFFVDAIQQLGALPLDVRRANIDILAADAHKWLLGPEGIAVFYCRQSARERLQLSQFGWRMVDDPYDFDRPAWQPSESARRFEPGSPNMVRHRQQSAGKQHRDDTPARIHARCFGRQPY